MRHPNFRFWEGGRRGGRGVDPKEGSEAEGAKASKGHGRCAGERFSGAKGMGEVVSQLQARDGLIEESKALLLPSLLSSLFTCASVKDVRLGNDEGLRSSILSRMLKKRMTNCGKYKRREYKHWRRLVPYNGFHTFSNPFPYDFLRL